MIDENYKPMPGRLSDKDITFLCIGEDPMISPFLAKQSGKPSAGLSSAGYDFRLGDKYLVQSDLDINSLSVIDPLNKEHQDIQWEERISDDGVIVVPPLGCILAQTVEKMNMPDDIVGTVLGKSTYARCNLLCNTTPIEPGWRGVVTLELHNCSPVYSIMLRVGQGISQIVFDRMPNPPSRTYSNRESGGVYQDQQGVTVSK